MPVITGTHMACIHAVKTFFIYFLCHDYSSFISVQGPCYVIKEWSHFMFFHLHIDQKAVDLNWRLFLMTLLFVFAEKGIRYFRTC